VSHIHSIAYSPYGHAFENPVPFFQAGPGTASHSVLARLFDPSVYRFILVEYLTRISGRVFLWEENIFQRFIFFRIFSDR
jgi:hypothetical protein